jgi:dienelactone hydrolase
MRALLLLLLACSLPAQTASIRDRMARLIGGLPTERTPLNARVTGQFQREGYRVEKIVFESLPGFLVTGNLYVPTTGPGPFPAVLGTAGHADNGKAYAVYQHVWISLARRGFVVFAIDPVSQGERLEYADASGKSRLGPGVNEHIHSGLQCLLTGAPIARYFIWDGMRAIDYLKSRPEVDSTRLGVAGNSGGGTQSAYLAVFEPSLRAVVSACYITRWKELQAGPGPQDAEQIFPSFLKEGLDFVDFIRAHAPKPFLIASAQRDFFPIAGARATYDSLRQFKDVEMIESDAEHGWGPPLREGTYRFLEKHLLGRTESAPEAPVQPETDEMLRVLAPGERSPETIYSLNRARARQVFEKRAALRIQDPAALRALIRDRIGVPAVSRVARTAPAGARPALLAVAASESDLEAYRTQGYVVKTFQPALFPAGRGGYTGAYQAAAREWLHGRTLLGNLVGELTGMLAELRADPQVDPRKITLLGRGNHAVTVQLLAALEGPVERVEALSPPPSWFEITQQADHRDLAEIVVPGVLLDFDLPDLAPLLPRPR